MAADGTIPESDPFGDITNIINIIKGIFGQQGNTTESTTSPAGDAMGQLLPQLLQMFQQNDFSQAAAVRDSQGSVDQILQQMAEKFPELVAPEAASGAYNSTTKQLLSNNLAARAAAEAAAKVSGTKTSYATAQAQQVAQLIGLMS